MWKRSFCARHPAKTESEDMRTSKKFSSRCENAAFTHPLLQAYRSSPWDLVTLISTHSQILPHLLSPWDHLTSAQLILISTHSQVVCHFHLHSLWDHLTLISTHSHLDSRSTHSHLNPLSDHLSSSPALRSCHPQPNSLSSSLTLRSSLTLIYSEIISE